MEIYILRIVEWTNKKFMFNYFTKLQKLIYLKRLEQYQYIVFMPYSCLFLIAKAF